MKKFITVSPFQPKENLTKGKYAAVDNSKLLYDGEIQFPILTAINGYVEDGEEINVLCIQADYDNAIENTKELFCLNEVSLNSKLLDFLSQNHVIVHFFNYYGMYSGTFYPKDQYLSGRLLVAQVNKYQTDR